MSNESVARGRRPDGSRAARWGAVCLLLRPTYVVTELLVASTTRGRYSLVSDSVSRLGEAGCSATYCSPHHGWMNASFVGFGALLVAGAVLMVRPLGSWATALLVVSGLSSIATGLAPLDQGTLRHTLAAAPLFIAQPAALLVLGARLRSQHAGLARALAATAYVTAAAAAAFVLSGDGPAAGALERLALWPVLGGLAAYAATYLRSTHRS